MSYKKDRPKQFPCVLGQLLLFGFAEKFIPLALLFLSRIFITWLARLNCAAEAFHAVPCKNPLPTLNSISVDQSLF